MIHDTKSAQISQKQDERNIYVIMKTMCPLDCHHNGNGYIYIYITQETTKTIWLLKINTLTSSFSKHSGGTPGLSVTDRCF